MQNSCGVKFYAHRAPTGHNLVWAAIPATGNCFRRHSLGFSPSQYVDTIERDRKDYDLITFVREPVDRFVAVWAWMKRQRKYRRRPLEEVLSGPPEKLDRHLRPQHTFEEVNDADYMGRFETLEEDWAILRERYQLGPLVKPQSLIGNRPLSEVLSPEELSVVLNIYARDFSELGYEQAAYLTAI